MDWWAKVRHSLHFGGVKAVEGAEAIGEVRGRPCADLKAGETSVAYVMAAANLQGGTGGYTPPQDLGRKPTAGVTRIHIARRPVSLLPCEASSRRGGRGSGSPGVGACALARAPESNRSIAPRKPAKSK